MKIKTLLLSVFAGLFTIVVMTGCDHGHDHDNGHSHDSANQETDKTNKKNSTTHDNID